MAEGRAGTPYAAAPDRAFWSRAVARGFDAAALAPDGAMLLTQADRVMSAGSCFAANIVPHLERAGLSYLRSETMHPMLSVPPEALGYESFSAAYGNIYTARQLLQLLRRALGQWMPAESVWREAGSFVDPFRPGLRYRAGSDAEFAALTRQHLVSVKRAFEEASVLVFTLGLTEAWVSTIDGAVFPACPGTVAGTFDAQRHAFVNFTAGEVAADLAAFIALVRAVNPSLRLILTVSPVPLVATASGRHVLEASVYSKSALRAAAGEIAASHKDVVYFPAYEIVTGPQAPRGYFEADRRAVSKAGVNAVMAALLAHCETGRPRAAAPLDAQGELRRLSHGIIQAACEEEMSDPGRHIGAEARPVPVWKRTAIRAKHKARRGLNAALARIRSRSGQAQEENS